MTEVADRDAVDERPPARRLRTDDLHCLAVWVASRVAVAVLAVGGAWLLSGAQAGGVEGFLRRWDRWDVGLFRKVAEFGYAGYPQDYPDQGVEA